ncbi:MAG: family 43 glycosylhydrolase [Myxococcales bacterium]|nr:family 43 glycosylhydrolase [Myxococcales bacterium]
MNRAAMRKVLFTIGLLLSWSVAASAQTPQYGDYIDLPGSGYPADPDVIESGGTWYLYPTNSNTTIECWTSADLETWAYGGVVWGPAEPGAWNDNNIWAPDVWEDDGTFYLYYAANNKLGVAVADDPLGPFVDVYDHPLIGGGYGGSINNAIDAEMFRDDDGSLYLYSTGYFPFGALRVFPLADPVTVGGPWRFLFMANPLSWEGTVNEGPFMIVHEGVYYLMYSGNGANTPQYGIGYATADNPLGPFAKYECNPILKSDADYDFWGPGHHSLTIGPDGDWRMFYHTKLNSEINWERDIRQNKVAFTDDGQLYVDLGLGEPEPLDDDDDDDNDDDNDDDDDSGNDDDDDDDDDNDDDTADDDQTDDDGADDDDADDEVTPGDEADDDEDEAGCGC